MIKIDVIKEQYSHHEASGSADLYQDQTSGIGWGPHGDGALLQDEGKGSPNPAAILGRAAGAVQWGVVTAVRSGFGLGKLMKRGPSDAHTATSVLPADEASSSAIDNDGTGIVRGVAVETGARSEFASRDEALEAIDRQLRRDLHEMMPGTVDESRQVLEEDSDSAPVMNGRSGLEKETCQAPLIRADEHGPMGQGGMLASAVASAQREGVSELDMNEGFSEYKEHGKPCSPSHFMEDDVVKGRRGDGAERVQGDGVEDTSESRKARELPISLEEGLNGGVDGGVPSLPGYNSKDARTQATRRPTVEEAAEADALVSEAMANYWTSFSKVRFSPGRVK